MHVCICLYEWFTKKLVKDEKLTYMYALRSYISILLACPLQQISLIVI